MLVMPEHFKEVHMARKAKVKRKQMMEDELDYAAMIDADREIDMSRPEINANTDDMGNPIAIKDKIQIAPQKTAQQVSDFEALQAMKLQRSVEADNKKQAAVEDDTEPVKKQKVSEKRKKFLIQLSKYAKQKVK